MKFDHAASIAVLIVATFTGTFHATARASGHQEADGAAFRGSSFCPDLAHTGLFRSKGLEYVHTMTFAEALLTVAGGKSPFAPPPVPPEWQSTATNWTIHLVGHVTGIAQEPFKGVAWERFSSEENPCDPQLLYRASLEYRARPGNGNAAVLFPYYAPMASHELEEMLRPLALRIGRVSSKIEAAEQSGAKECAPGKVARAKELLETARRAAAEFHYDGDALGTFFLPAELAAEELLEERRFAAARGIRCFSTN